jgi:P2 family phage contractile tail tube protein
MKKPQTILGVNIFVDGIGHLGVSKSVTLPKITEGSYDVSVGGLTKEVSNGTLEKMECSFTLQEYSPVVYAALAAQTALDSIFIFKATVNQGSEDKPLVAIVKGRIKEIDDGDLEAKKEVERKVTLSVSYYALEIDGVQGALVDVDNLIYIVDGVDRLATIRQNLQ